MLQPIKRTKIYEGIVEQLKQLIYNGTLKPGDQLPNERDLAEKLNVSRTSIREALRSLEMMGYIESKVGVGGGTFVKEITIEKIIEPFAGLLLKKDELILDLIEFRLILESEIARLAAKRRTEDDLVELEKSLEVSKEEVTNGQLGLSGDNLFHSAVAKAAHNEVFLKVLEMSDDLLVESRKTALENFSKPEITIDHHKHIFEAIKNSDSRLAAKTMKHHMDEARKHSIIKIKKKNIK